MKFFNLLIFVLTTYLYSVDIKPIPEYVVFDSNKAKLGKKLFYDTILSQDGTISCSHCHDLLNGGDDGLKYSYGIKGKQGHINTPTVLNSIFNFRQFWDGRAKDLEEQALGPIENPVEMGMNFDNIVKKLQNNMEYKKIFESVYQDGVTKKNILNAIVEYEKTLITPNAPFDRYLKGDLNAISKKAKRGYKLFITPPINNLNYGIILVWKR